MPQPGAFGCTAKAVQATGDAEIAPHSSNNDLVAHVFQMMAGTSKYSPISFRGLQTARSSDSIVDLQIESSLLDSLNVFGADDTSGKMCTCPVCRGSSVVTLTELAATPDSQDADGFFVPDVHVGATGIVMPGRSQLARWFRVPLVPQQAKSKLHAKAVSEAKHHSAFTFFSTFAFLTVFFTPCLLTIWVAFAIAAIAGVRTFSGLKAAARKEDEGIQFEMAVRVHAYKARMAAWDKLYFCSGCGMVHDREGKRSLPWYSMLQLVHYPEQEFLKVATPLEGPSILHSEATRSAA